MTKDPSLAKEPKSDATRAFGQRVRAVRVEMNLSQEGLADKLGVHPTYVGQVERGTRNVSLHTILRFMIGLEVDGGLLINGLVPPPPEPRPGRPPVR